MKIIDASYKINTPISDGGLQELKLIEKAGRACYKSEDKITEDGESAKKFVKMLIANQHEAMLEHSSLTVVFTCNRGVSHEIVRHRIASFAQESQRYCSYNKDKFGNEISVIDIKNGIKLDSKMANLNRDEFNTIYSEWIDAMKDAEKHYMKLINLGATPQMARSVLPNSTKTEITVTANYREWRNILKLRTSGAAHPEIRELMMPLCRELQSKIPIVFDDILPSDKTTINCEAEAPNEAIVVLVDEKNLGVK